MSMLGFFCGALQLKSVNSRFGLKTIIYRIAIICFQTKFGVLFPETGKGIYV